MAQRAHLEARLPHRHTNGRFSQYECSAPGFRSLGSRHTRVTESQWKPPLVVVPSPWKTTESPLRARLPDRPPPIARTLSVVLVVAAVADTEALEVVVALQAQAQVQAQVQWPSLSLYRVS